MVPYSRLLLSPDFEPRFEGKSKPNHAFAAPQYMTMLTTPFQAIYHFIFPPGLAGWAGGLGSGLGAPAGLAGWARAWGIRLCPGRTRNKIRGCRESQVAAACNILKIQAK